MTEINRKAGAIWTGDSRNGTGVISTESRILYEQPYSHESRFDGQNTSQTNPEELIAAAHAAGFSMSLGSTLKKNGYNPMQIETTATIKIVSGNDGNDITSMRLHVRADVPSLDDAALQTLIAEADQHCLVSNLLRKGLDMEIKATLVGAVHDR
jgi:osmotically inducible protein OsmC